MALRSRWSDASLESKVKKSNPKNGIPPTIELDGSVPETNSRVSQDTVKQRPSLSEELDYVNIRVEKDKASRILGIQHRTSMEPIPASARNSIVSTRSARPAPPSPSFSPTSPSLVFTSFQDSRNLLIHGPSPTLILFSVSTTQTML
ncbi:hypothetical protein K438DRAFT_632725 [Mycena galopus ATCC 62051]|nr:hypothetical protein K438DRAFT_632725 [Mycena galopus ATCC 62051]